MKAEDELRAIRALWTVDREMGALRDEAARLARAVSDLRAEVQRRRDEIAALEARIEEARQEERRLNRRLEAYVERRDKARRLVETGAVGDLISAQRQYEQCAAIVDDIETELLEAMERREALEAELERMRAGEAYARQRLDAARREQAERRPALEARYRELEPLRAERRAAIAPELLGTYEALRGKGEPATRVVAGSCEHCHMAVAPQAILEIRADKRLHACRGCGRFLLEVVDLPRDEGGE